MDLVALELCPICQLPIPVDQLERHASRCVGEGEGRACRFCGARVFFDDSAAHEQRCEKTYAASLKDQQLALQHARFEQLSQTDELVSQQQFQTLTGLNRLAKKQSDAALPKLQARFESKLGMKHSDLQQVLEYLRLRAPLVIHVNMEAYVDFFLKDTCYRNCFEVRAPTPGGRPLTLAELAGNVRAQWESRIFHQRYDASPAAERCKYGALSIFSHPQGVRAAHGYGTSYFVLRDDRVRLRTSFASCDTSSGAVKIGMCEHAAHVLAEYGDAELREIVAIAAGRIPYGDDSKSGIYKEIQIHGLVRFDRDIERLVVPARLRSNLPLRQKIELFCTHNKIRLEWVE